MKYQCPLCKEIYDEKEWEQRSKQYHSTIQAVFGTEMRASCCPKCKSLIPNRQLIPMETEEKKG